MSTVQATNLKSALSTTNNAIMTAGGDFTNAAGISYMGGTKNLLINSAMQVNQRSSSSAGITSGGYYTSDRWNILLLSLGTWTQSVQNDAPLGSGLRNSLKMLCTTANASPSAGSYVAIDQRLEGQDLQRIAKGTASAQQITLSFWVKSNVTGTYVAWLYDNDNNRHVGATYTVSASATWERKVISFPADATGIFDNDANASLYVRWWLGSGTDRTSGTLATTWISYTAANAAVGQTNLAASTNNYWQITGTQLEIGSVATSFEFEPYETTLRKCQRYCVVMGGTNSYEVFANGSSTSTTQGRILVPMPQTMRIAPSTTISSAGHFEALLPGIAAQQLSSLVDETSSVFSSPMSALLVAGHNANANFGSSKAIMLRASDTTSARLIFSSEL